MRVSVVVLLTSLVISFAYAQPTEVDIGLSTWSLDGNEHKLRQYGTPAKGLFLNVFRHTLPPIRDRNGWFTLKGTERNDYRFEGDLAFLFGRSRWKTAVSRYRFFDPTPIVVLPSTRAVREAGTKFLLTPDFSISLHYLMDQQDQFFEAPKLPLRQRTRFWSAITEGKIGESRVSLGYTDFRYFDRTDIRPDTFVKRWHVNYLWQPSQVFGIEGSFLRSSIKQPIRPDSEVETVALSGDWSIAVATDFSVHLRRDKLDLPVVQNAWVRERRFGVANLVHRWRHWTLQVGFRQQENERIRKDQSAVDVPRWRTWEARLSGRVGKNWRLALRGSIQHLTHLPTMVTTDPRQLFWDNRRFAQLKLEGGSPTLNGYLILTHRRWDNDVRAVELTTNAVLLGGTWNARAQLSLFAEYAYEAWRAKSEMAAFPTLDNFVPNSRITTFGLNWAIDRRTFLSAAFTEFVTANDNPLLLRDGNYRGRFLTASLSYRFPAGYEVVLTVSPWRYRDRVVDLMDYEATVVMVSGKARF